MPIYEYVCRACGQPSEILQKISEPDAKQCPHCGKRSLTRQVSAAGFRLKGGGWYETDFKSGNKKNLVGDTAEKPATPSADATPAKTDAAAPTTPAKPAPVKEKPAAATKKKTPPAAK